MISMIEKVFQINFRVVALLLLGYALLSMQNSFGQATQTFSTSGSFTVPAGVTAITVTSALRNIIPAFSNTLNTAGSGSPPTFVLLTLLIHVFITLLYRNGGWHHDSAPIYC